MKQKDPSHECMNLDRISYNLGTWEPVLLTIGHVESSHCYNFRIRPLHETGLAGKESTRYLVSLKYWILRYLGQFGVEKQIWILLGTERLALVAWVVTLFVRLYGYLRILQWNKVFVWHFVAPMKQVNLVFVSLVLKYEVKCMRRGVSSLFIQFRGETSQY